MKTLIGQEGAKVGAAQLSTEEAVGALLGLYKVPLPAEGDFTDAEQAAMDAARRVLCLAGVDLQAIEA